jgi:hypothetical protein
VNAWPGGFQGEITVQAGTANVNGWTVRFTTGTGQTVTQLWNGTVSTNGTANAVRNASWNGSLAANASTAFGFLASGSGTPSVTGITCTSP